VASQPLVLVMQEAERKGGSDRLTHGGGGAGVAHEKKVNMSSFVITRRSFL
jgi:hypothetical protein